MPFHRLRRTPLLARTPFIARVTNRAHHHSVSRGPTAAATTRTDARRRRSLKTVHTATVVKLAETALGFGRKRTLNARGWPCRSSPSTYPPRSSGKCPRNPIARAARAWHRAPCGAGPHPPLAIQSRERPAPGIALHVAPARIHQRPRRRARARAASRARPVCLPGPARGPVPQRSAARRRLGRGGPPQPLAAARNTRRGRPTNGPAAAPGPAQPAGPAPFASRGPHGGRSPSAPPPAGGSAAAARRNR